MTSIEWLIKKIINEIMDSEYIDNLSIEKTNLLRNYVKQAKEMHYKETMNAMQKGMELQEKENNRIGFRERNGLLPQQEISDENITKQSWIYEPRDKFDAAFLREAFIRGAEWYREQLNKL